MAADREVQFKGGVIRPRPSRLAVVWGWLFNLAVYGMIGWVAFNRDRLAIRARLAPESSLFANGWLLIVAVTLILLLTAAVHEIGHVLAGRLMDLRFQLLVVGPFKLSRETGRLRFGLGGGGGLFSGLAASVPVDGRHLRRRMLGFALGGAVANALLALVAALLAFGLARNRQFAVTHAWMIESAVATAASSFIFLLTAMKPGLYPSGLPADGQRVLQLLQGGPAANRWCALVALNGADIYGRRPCDWDTNLVQQAISVPDGSHDDLMARVAAYQWALDSGRLEQAVEFLDSALSSRAGWISGTPARLALEKVYLLARHGQEPAEARHWFERIKLSHTTHPLQQRAEAAVLLAEGDHEAARNLAEAALANLQRAPRSGVRQAEMEWLQDIIRLAQTA